MTRSKKRPNEQSQLAAEIVRLTSQIDEADPEQIDSLLESTRSSSLLSEYIAEIGSEDELKVRKTRAGKTKTKPPKRSRKIKD